MTFPQEEGKYTYADYLTFPEGERWEIMEGIAYMQAAPSPIHQEVLGGLYSQIYQYLLDKPCKVYPAPFCVKLISGNEKKNEDIKMIVEPDISIVCDPSKIDQRGCNGAPDWVVEIVSPSSARIDKFIKFNQYEKAGVKEYWIVEPDIKLVSVFILQENGRYGRPEIFTEEDRIKISIFADLEINLRLIFD